MDFYLFILVFVILFLLYLLSIHLANQQHIVHVRDTKRHLWKRKKSDSSSSSFCQICELLFISGFVCDLCEIACDKEECLSIADKVNNPTINKEG